MPKLTDIDKTGRMNGKPTRPGKDDAGEPGGAAKSRAGPRRPIRGSDWLAQDGETMGPLSLAALRRAVVSHERLIADPVEVVFEILPWLVEDRAMVVERAEMTAHVTRLDRAQQVLGLPDEWRRLLSRTEARSRVEDLNDPLTRGDIAAEMIELHGPDINRLVQDLRQDGLMPGVAIDLMLVGAAMERASEPRGPAGDGDPRDRDPGAGPPETA